MSTMPDQSEPQAADFEALLPQALLDFEVAKLVYSRVPAVRVPEADRDADQQDVAEQAHRWLGRRVSALADLLTAIRRAESAEQADAEDADPDDPFGGDDESEDAPPENAPEMPLESTTVAEGP